ncbi:putative strigolactone esterase DAD2 [Wolffia australiana]
MVDATKSLADLMNARTIGSGETTLVLSHGYGADQTIWDEVLPGLVQRYHIVLFNWNFPAAAAAAEPAYKAFSVQLIHLIEEMGLSDVVFVGHSMAGMVGCIAAAQRPNIFRRLVLVGASPRYLNSDGYIGGLTMKEVAGLFAMMEHDFNGWACSFAMAMVGVPAMAERFSQMLQRMNPQVALTLAKSVFLSDCRELLKNVKVSCTVINGSRDPVVPMTAADFIQQNLAGEASLLTLDFDGHFPQLTVPKLLVDALYAIASS